MSLLRFVVLTCSTLGLSATALAKPPGEWTCAEGFWEDEVCDCGCGATDPDCSGSTFEGCERNGCGAGQVPWEHAPASCMTSACGDGWRDEAAGEVCDDGDGLASGGCSADCKSVNPGWTCGDRAEKCSRSAPEPTPEASPDASPEPGPEASPEPAPEASPEPSPDQADSDDAQAAGGGCAGAASPTFWVGLVGIFGGLGLLRRRAGRLSKR